MARPAKNTVDYYSHDKDMRNDPKIKALRTKYGLAGYALWCMMLEHLCDSENLEVEDTELSAVLMAGDFGVSEAEMTDFLSFCFRIDLLQQVSGRITCRNLKKRLQPVFDKRRKLSSKKQVTEVSDAETSRNDTSPGVSEAETPIDPTSTEVSEAETLQSKVKESKVKESKEYIYPREFLRLWNDYPNTNGSKTQTHKNYLACKKQLGLSDEQIYTAAMNSAKKQRAKGITHLFQLSNVLGTKYRDDLPELLYYSEIERDELKERLNEILNS
jgi:hypothetical protein